MRINQDALRTVVFFGVASPPAGEIAYGGTGFLGYVMGADGRPHPYIITNRHVAEALDAAGSFVIRANLKKGGMHEIEIVRSEWYYHPDKNEDVAATPFYMDGNVFDHHYLDLADWALAPDAPPVKEAECGDVISIVGLFRLHFGKQRNIPIVHTGHIATLPDSSERIPSKDRRSGERRMIEGYLVEAQTLEGLSGSPVFIRQVATISDLPIGPNGAVASLLSKSGHRITAYAGVKLLGIYQGAWDAKPGEILAADRGLNGELRVPVGMGIVVPTNKILELIKEHPVLKKHREHAEAVDKAAREAKTDSAFPSPPQSTDENPTHREDFMRLASAAAQTRKQGE